MSNTYRKLQHTKKNVIYLRNFFFRFFSLCLCLWTALNLRNHVKLRWNQISSCYSYSWFIHEIFPHNKFFFLRLLRQHAVLFLQAFKDWLGVWWEQRLGTRLAAVFVLVPNEIGDIKMTENFWNLSGNRCEFFVGRFSRFSQYIY